MIRSSTRWLLYGLIFSMALPACRSQEEVHANTVGALVRDRNHKELVQLFSDESIDLRCRAAKAIAWMEGSDLHTAHVAVTQIQGCSWKVRAEAMWRLVEGGDTTTLNTAIGLLTDTEVGLRWNTARALGKYRKSSARDALIACQSDADPHVRLWCTWAICRLDKSPQCVRPKNGPVDDSLASQ